jgi:hypothetical protein
VGNTPRPPARAVRRGQYGQDRHARLDQSRAHGQYMSATGVVLALPALGVAVGLQSGILAGAGPTSASGRTDGHISTRRYDGSPRERKKEKRTAHMTDHSGDGIQGHTDPGRTDVPGRWRITLSRVMPEGSWRERLLEVAQAMPEGQKLGLAVEGSTVDFDCPDTDDQGMLREHLHTRIRLINRLIREAAASSRC